MKTGKAARQKFRPLLSSFHNERIRRQAAQRTILLKF
jgi:hypothetical protein